LIGREKDHSASLERFARVGESLPGVTALFVGARLRECRDRRKADQPATAVSSGGFSSVSKQLMK
jgi:hypothetical protein